MEQSWAGAGEPLATVEEIAGAVVDRGRQLPPAAEAPVFTLFAAVCERPTLPGRVLRLITAVRYRRADAHRAAVAAAGLDFRAAHALNVPWDRHRGLTRLGQGFPEPGSSVALLEQRGLAERGTISESGLTLREEVERDTDRRIAPLYEHLDQPSRGRFLAALAALPGAAHPGLPG